jgi:transcriptional regulator
MHYEMFKQYDPAAMRTLIETFPFAMIAVNGEHGPLIAQAPLTFRPDIGKYGAVDFHLARENAFVAALDDGVDTTIVVKGPQAHVSPSWYTGRFSGANPDRSHTAPTFNYVSVVLQGKIEILDEDSLHRQVEDLVNDHEPADGWRFEEIDPQLFENWCRMLVGVRAEIDSFDMTAKISQDQAPTDRVGITTGLLGRNAFADKAMATIVDRFDGSPETLVNALSRAKLDGK